MSSGIPLDEIIHRLNDMAIDVAEDCVSNGRRSGQEYSGECSGKVSVRIAGNKVGVVGFWHDQGPGRKSNGGGLLDLIWLRHGCKDFGEAVRVAKSYYLKIADDWKPDPEQQRRWKAEQAQRKQQRAEEAAQTRAEAIANAKRFWDQCVPAAGTLAERYLVNRCKFLEIGADLPPTIRYHPAAPNTEAGRCFPALIGGVQDAKNKVISVWRIFLNKEGGKAPVEHPKLGLGPAGGGGVRLGPLGPRVILCEGIETGFGVRFLTDGKIPVICGLSTSGISGFVPPPVVEHVSGYLDGDLARFNKATGKLLQAPGEKAGFLFADRAVEHGVTTDLQVPPPESDWLDVANSLAEEA